LECRLSSVKRTRKPKKRGRVRERGSRLDLGGCACYEHCECGETRRCWTTRAFSVGGLVVRACGSKFTLSSPPKRKPAGPHFQRTGAVPRLWRVTRLVEIDAAAAGCPQQDSPAWSSLAALQTAWPGCSVDHRNRTLYRAACSWWPSVTESSIEFANERSRSPPSGAAGRRLSTAAASVVRGGAPNEGSRHRRSGRRPMPALLRALCEPLRECAPTVHPWRRLHRARQAETPQLSSGMSAWHWRYLMRRLRSGGSSCLRRGSPLR
jgi:hypothetical protein